MGSCCSRCTNDDDASAVIGATSDGFLAAASFPSSVTPVSFRPRQQHDEIIQQQILPPVKQGVENAAFSRSDEASTAPDLCQASASAKSVSNGPKCHFHFPDWLGTMATRASRHRHLHQQSRARDGGPSSSNNRRKLTGIIEQVNECAHVSDAYETGVNGTEFLNNLPAKMSSLQYSGDDSAFCLHRQLTRDHGATSSLRQEPVSRTIPSESTDHQNNLDGEQHQNGNHLCHSHHSFHGDDVYRIFVESSWHVKSSILSLFAANLSKSSNGNGAKKRKNEWIQLSGHCGTFAVAGPWSIWKRRDPREVNELQAYKLLMQSEQLRQFVPIFYREVEHRGEYFLELEDLLHHFKNPSIMDVKMGSRTFLESEVTNPVLRTDLYKKMVELDPNEPTAEEKQHQAVTKLRYMRFREKESTSITLGFRLDAIRTKDPKTCEQYSLRLKTAKTEAEVADIMHYFCAYNPVIMRQYARRLTDLRTVLEGSSFFKSHELIGSSLLFLHDETLKANAWMIDFAKTVPHQELRLSHAVEWQLGNHEDGYLTGLNNLIRLLDGMANQYV